MNGSPGDMFFPSLENDQNPCYHPVFGPGSSYNRSPLHKAICEMDMTAVQQELSDNIGAASLLRRDEAGYFPIHSAAALSMASQNNSTTACEFVKMLLASGGEASAVDSKRNTPLHWAARAGDGETARILLSHSCPPGELHTRTRVGVKRTMSL